MNLYTKTLEFLGTKVLRTKPIFQTYQESLKESERELFNLFARGSVLLQQGRIQSWSPDEIDEKIKSISAIDFNKYKMSRKRCQSATS